MTARGTRPDAFAAALDYHARGWSVVQIYPIGSDGHCACPTHCASAGKHPIRGTRDGALLTEAAIRRAYRENHGAGVGIVLGNGLVAIDVDPRHGGHVEETADGYHVTGPGGFVSVLPRTRVQRSGGGGCHLLFTTPPGVHVRNRSLAGNAVELKGSGGFIVAAPTCHSSGEPYEWIDDTPSAPLPAHLFESTEAQQPTKPGPTACTRASGSTAECIEAIYAACLARRGTRHGQEIRFCCPAHDDTHPSASWNERKRVWRCHACGANGGYLDLGRRLGIDLPHPSERTSARVQRWRKWLADQHWPGVQGAIDKAVSLAILDDVEKSGQLERALSVRRVAELAGVSRQVIAGEKHPGVLRRLVECGMLRCIRKAEWPNGRWYRLCAAPRGVRHQEDRVSGKSSTDSGTSVTHPDRDAYLDVFRNGTGLGKGCQGLYERIGSRPMAKAELLAGLPKEKRRSRWRTLTRQWARLTTLGLARPGDRGGWVGVEPPDGWEAVARGLRSNGATARQRQRIEAERAAYRQWIAIRQTGTTGRKLQLVPNEATNNRAVVDVDTDKALAERKTTVPATVWALAVNPTEYTRAAVAFWLAVLSARARSRIHRHAAQRGAALRERTHPTWVGTRTLTEGRS